MSKNKTKIHIHAKCDAFEIFELRTEKQAPDRLRKIQEMHAWADRRAGSGRYGILPAGKLIVKTGVHNPTIPFL